MDDVLTFIQSTRRKSPRFPTYSELVLKGKGYNVDDYEFIEYILVYEGKVSWRGEPVPRIAGLKYVHKDTGEELIINL